MSKDKANSDYNNPFNNETIVTFLEQHAFYPKNNIYTQDSEKPLYDKFKDYYQKGKKVLIFGVGTGRDIDLIIKAGVNIDKNDFLGYDFSEAMIKKCIDKFPNFKFTSNNPLLDNQGHFDIIICNNVLQHVKDSKAFNELMKQLSDKADITLCHFWYDESNNFYKPLQLRGFTIDEFWIGKKTLIYISNDLPGNCQIEFFKTQKPSSSAFLEVNKITIQQQLPAEPEGKNQKSDKQKK